MTEYIKQLSEEFNSTRYEVKLNAIEKLQYERDKCQDIIDYSNEKLTTVMRGCHEYTSNMNVIKSESETIHDINKILGNIKEVQTEVVTSTKDLIVKGYKDILNLVDR